MAPLASEKVITKHYANSFRETDLLETLQKLGTKRLVLCGMQTHMCVEAAHVHAAALAALQGTYATVVTTADIVGSAPVPAK